MRFHDSLRLASLVRRAAVGAAVLALLAASALPAQTPTARATGDTVTLTLDQAIGRANSQSEEVRLARSQVALADAQVTAARAGALPQLDGAINYTRTFDSPFNTGGFTLPDSLRFEPDTTVSLAERVRYLEQRTPLAGLAGIGSLFSNLPFGQQNSYTAALTGTQPLYAGGRIGAALRIASEYRESARLGLTEQVADIEMQVRNAYYRALLAQELERIAAAAVEQAEAFLAQERLRRSAGTASDLDVLRAEVSLENLRPQLIGARNAASLATLDLKRLLDLPLQQPVRLTTPLTMPSAAELATPSVDASLLLAQRAAVRAAERQVAIREQQVRIARGGYLPSVDLRVNYGKQAFPSQLFSFGGVDWRTDWTATVGVRVPLFSGFRTQAEVQQARIGLEQEQLRLSQLRENVQLQYEQALGERARAAADLAARQRTVEQAQRVHDLTVLRYQQGLATQLEVTDARLALLQARTNLAQAISGFYLADAGVTRALGTPTSVQPIGTSGIRRAP
ncbi:MAG TPA: TolC family protein [Gemmatimonadaceae bacterium]|nr:TolC family protein [Gemmatimonadaceae bacterium]